MSRFKRKNVGTETPLPPPVSSTFQTVWFQTHQMLFLKPVTCLICCRTIWHTFHLPPLSDDQIILRLLPKNIFLCFENMFCVLTMLQRSVAFWVLFYGKCKIVGGDFGRSLCNLFEALFKKWLNVVHVWLPSCWIRPPFFNHSFTQNLCLFWQLLNLKTVLDFTHSDVESQLLWIFLVGGGEMRKKTYVIYHYMYIILAEKT